MYDESANETGRMDSLKVLNLDFTLWEKLNLSRSSLCNKKIDILGWMKLVLKLMNKNCVYVVLYSEEELRNLFGSCYFT